jgi:hypothetical protein
LKRRLFPQFLIFFLFVASMQVFANDTANVASDQTLTPEPAESKQAVPEGSKFTYTPSGFATLQMLRIVNYDYTNKEYSDLQINNVVANLTLDFNFSPRFKAHIGIEGYVWFNSLPDNEIRSGQVRNLDPQWSFYIHQAENVLLLPSGENFSGELGLGYFPYKYNPQAQNLGEYLFRSGTYPGWIISTFDWPKARLLGARFSSTLFKAWHNDLLLTTEMEMYPLYDLSFSWISSIPVGKVLDIGAGIDFCRFLPYRDSWTTPKIADTMTVNNSFIKENGDTGYYTFTGTKAMLRMTFDFKGFFPEKPGIFGDEDGKLYFEGVSLALQNQGTLYDKFWQRIPVMMGFNIPTFKLLDVVALEAEYYRNPYPNSYRRQLIFLWDGTPLPSTPSILGTNIYDRNFWKWSVYAKRSIGKHFMVIVQAARDHWRTHSAIGYYVNDPEEGLRQTKDWYWALKAVTVF